MRKIYMLIGGSALAVLLLISFQFYWIHQSKKLIDDQFTNRVSMALCSAVEKISDNPSSCLADPVGCALTPGSNCQSILQSMIRDSGFVQEINKSLAFYQIHLPYNMSLATKDSSADCDPQYSCSLAPIISQDDHWVKLVFQGKKDYIHQQLGSMWWASILIVLSIISMFLYATNTLIRQKKLSEENVKFFNHMTHEFSTPLTNIHLATSLINKSNTDTRIAGYIQILSAETSNLKKQLGQVLSLANSNHQGIQLDKSKTDLLHLVEEAITGMQLQINEKSAVIYVHASERAYPILADKVHVRNVIKNLIDNALKYNNDRPEINIDIIKTNDQWCVRVRDNGMGIHENEHSKIFDPFYRGANQMNTSNGFGLGLNYVKKILHLHEGDIHIESIKPNGSSFNLYFPKLML